jgi:hypothetical protein
MPLSLGSAEWPTIQKGHAVGHAECFRYLKSSYTAAAATLLGREALLREKLSLDRCEFHIDEELNVSSISIYSHCTLPRRVEEFSYLL